MAQKHGLIEIRLDRRQAFYALVGSLLIVSVAFVVGLIVGQRMQLTAANTPELAVTGHDDNAGREPTQDDAEAEPEQPHYTFYDELASEPPRPLLNPTATPPAPPAEPIGEQVAAIRSLPRETPAQETAAAAAPHREEAEERPTPAVEVATAPTEPLEEPVRRQAPRVAPVDGPNAERAEEAEAPSLQRRTVRRVGGDDAESAGPEEFGYYTVEVGRFGSFAEANEQSDRLRQAGHEAIVTIVAEDGQPRQYRVQVGSFTRRTEANRAADSISGLGMRARVVQEG